MLEERSGLKFFVNGVKPDWDDKETASGGIWSVPIKRGPDCKERLEQYWVDVVWLLSPGLCLLILHSTFVTVNESITPSAKFIGHCTHVYMPMSGCQLDCDYVYSEAAKAGVSFIWKQTLCVVY